MTLFPAKRDNPKITRTSFADADRLKKEMKEKVTVSVRVGKW